MTGRNKNSGWYARRGKRVFDLVVSTLLLCLLLPVFVVLSLVALVADGPPVFFRQRRPGKGGKPFVLIKYRTMRPERARTLEEDALRLTRFGRFLRRSSLDELPELWCVLKGDMSLVGPRPLLVEYLPLYTPEQNRRHTVPPGLTGWAQVHGRNVLSWEEKFDYDIWYVDHCSLCLDLRILLMTFSKVLRGEGISAPEHATMPRFRGSQDSRK